MKDDRPLRVLVVDDTVVYRKAVSDILAELPDVEVVGTANNGKIAMSKIANLKPDILTLDIEMPEMNGLDVLARIKEEELDVGAIVLSTLTHKGGELTMQAMELGAFDFITKPETDSMEESRKEVMNAISPMLKAFARRREIKSVLGRGPSVQKAGRKEKPTNALDDTVRRMSAIVGEKRIRAEIVGIGISTGGPKALARMMPQIPADINVPILIVQHMPAIFTKSLANNLNSKCAFEVREALDGESILPNIVLIAPGGKQMKVVAGADGINRIIRITDDPPENSCKPSVDYLFRSIAQHYVRRAAGVIMTGMGSDGTRGLDLMKRNGAFIIAQDEETCVVYGMPKEPVESGIVDVIAPLDHIAEEIICTVRGSSY
ncbi:MAG: chemotaxis response regulator protein-glutamate methylesterase [Deltaproteobacteria bacterium]|nr:chemotaxis response regulator protein-glutamate methylesterase [Deltaproteobacteria bacterium]